MSPDPRDSNALFDEFHECQVMVSLFVNDTDLDRAFDEIFDIRRQIVDALQSDFAAPEDFGPECRMIYVGSYSEDDTVGLRQAKAVEQIKKKLRLFVRYEASEA